MMGANRVARQSTGRFLNAANISIRHRLPLGQQSRCRTSGRTGRPDAQGRPLVRAAPPALLCRATRHSGRLLPLPHPHRPGPAGAGPADAAHPSGEVFLQDNVRRIRRLIWNCAAVSLICLACARLYPPLLFVTIIMAFLCLVIAVVASIMDAATRLREENDLTI